MNSEQYGITFTEKVIAGVLIALALVVALLSAGCGADKPNVLETSEATKTTGLLFEYDGVRVYRFYDAGEYHYFAVPRNGTFASVFSQWSETASCGDNCWTTTHYSREIPTMGAQ